MSHVKWAIGGKKLMFIQMIISRELKFKQPFLLRLDL